MSVRVLTGSPLFIQKDLAIGINDGFIIQNVTALDSNSVMIILIHKSKLEIPDCNSCLKVCPHDRGCSN